MPDIPRTVPIAAAAAAALALLWPAAVEGGQRCGGLRPTIFGTAGSDHIVGKKAPDVIVGFGGNDVIDGYRGNDRICGGAGNDRITGFRGVDRIFGEEGDDVLNGFKGSDKLSGGAGNDLLMGVRGSDQMDGGPGTDALVGDRGNDRMQGGDGDFDVLDGGPGDETASGGPGNGDRLIGGLGADHLDGGPGDGDVVRGDDSTDTLDGGDGAQDIASFALATPPGQGRTEDNRIIDGVIVNLRNGTATGDGWDTMSGVEDVVGSAFEDELTGDDATNRLDGGPGNDLLNGAGGVDAAFGGSGGDFCLAFALLDSCENGDGQPLVGQGTTVELSRGLDGDTLNVIGTESPNRVLLTFDGSSYSVIDSVSRVNPSDNCHPISPQLNGGAVCPAPEGLTAVVVSLGSGDDAFAVGDGVPGSVAVRANGGYGNDQLIGGPGSDTLEAGEGGNDLLVGGGGIDGLLAGPGADQVQGGDGSDLMIVDDACGGHQLNGGAGGDNASFSRVAGGVVATLGGTAVSRGAGACNPVRIEAAESLEGSNGDDMLIGNGRENTFLGRTGNDVIRGKGGRDRIDGAVGADTLLGGGGNDELVAVDGQRDVKIDCGPGVSYEESASRDKVDPKSRSC